MGMKICSVLGLLLLMIGNCLKLRRNIKPKEGFPSASTNTCVMVPCPFYKYTSDECKMGFGDKCKPVACKLRRAQHQ